MNRRWTGEWLLALSAFHTAVGVLLGTGALNGLAAMLGVDIGLHQHGALFGIAGHGFVGAAMPKHAAEFGLFWFLCAGFLLGLLGALTRWLRRVHTIVAPPFVLWMLLSFAAVGIVMMPISGFPLLFVVSLALIIGGSRPVYLSAPRAEPR